MTNMLEARRAICNAFLAAWVDPDNTDEPLTPYALDNERFDPPTRKPWVRLIISEAAREQETLGRVGSRRWRTDGVAELQIYVLSDKGTKAADELVAEFRGLFEGAVVEPGSVNFLACSVQEVGKEGAWWRVNAFARFWFEERK